MSLVYPKPKQKRKRRKPKGRSKEPGLRRKEKKLLEDLKKNPERIMGDFYRAFPQLKPKRKRDIKQPKGSI